MGIIKSAALRLPPLRRIWQHRNALLSGVEALRTENATLASSIDALQDRAAALQTENRALQQRPAAIDYGVPPGWLAAVSLASRESRVVVTDYPYFPQERALAKAAGGRQLTERFRREQASYAAMLQRIAGHIGTLAKIPRNATTSFAPFWDNPWFPPFDGASLYGLLAETRPGRYIEVGSGISTRFARQAINDLGLSTRIVSIDPHPHNAVDGLCDEMIVARMEDMPAAFWAALAPDDMLFIDNSHRSFPASDVTVFFSEVMPALPEGTLFGLHDIFLPNDYPDVWKDRFYSEQYLLLTYLLGGGGQDTIVLPVHWAISQPALFATLAPLWDQQELFAGVNIGGGCFWLRRGPAV